MNLFLQMENYTQTTTVCSPGCREMEEAARQDALAWFHYITIICHLFSDLGLLNHYSNSKIKNKAVLVTQSAECLAKCL